jgi:hypothetical protein
MQSKSIIVCIVSLIIAGAASLADFPKPLKSAAAREDLVKHFGTTIGFGKVAKWEFTTAGRELLIFSYCPYSGRAACYAHAYYHDRTKHVWVLFIDRLIEPATSLSAEISADHSLVLKDRDGKIVAKRSIAELPQ